MEILTALLVSLLTILIVFLLSSYWKMLTYWEKRRVPQERPMLLFGNFLDVIATRTSSAVWLKDLCHRFDAPYFGVHIFQKPFLVLNTPELVKQILVKDFEFFNDRSLADSKHDEIIKHFPFMQRNPIWRTMRPRLSATFTTGKLKSMLENFNEVAKELTAYIKDGEIESRHLLSRYATEVTVKNFFGVTAHCFSEEKPLFLNRVEDLMRTGFRNGFVQNCFFFAHSLVNPLRLTFIEKKFSRFFIDTFLDILKKRQGSGVKYNDLADTILDMLKDEEFCKKTNFVNQAVAAPAINLMMGGNETSSTTISFALYELALQEDLKRKVVKEIVSCVQKHKGATYEAIQDMKYLTMCIKETLRKYPVLPFLNRECAKTYTLPGTDVVLEKGAGVLISLMGLHYDPKYFPEPEKYIPERYEGKVNDEGLYYIPFGEGPRMCIGTRFGMLSVQVALIHILTKFDVKVCPRTPKPLIFDPKTLMLTSKTGMVLKFESLEDPCVF